MAWRFVKQPNGLLARFSDVVDHFTHWNMTEPQALSFCASEGFGEVGAAEKVSGGVEDWEPWKHRVKGSGHSRWDDALETIEGVHGKIEADKWREKLSA